MNTGDESRSSASGGLHDVRVFVSAGITFVIGFLLYTWRPLWLAPPYHGYSPVLYVLLALAWTPLCAYGIWRLPKRRILGVVLAILFLQMTCVVGFAVSPHTYFELLHMRGTDHGSLEHGSLVEKDCSLQERVFTCELAVGSSDEELARFYSYRFEVVKDLPVMWLTSFHSRLDCNPAYASCSMSGSP